jgi:hypothetical protein
MPEADQRREYRLERGGDRTEPDELAAAARAAVLNPRVFTKYRFEYVSDRAGRAVSLTRSADASIDALVLPTNRLVFADPVALRAPNRRPNAALAGSSA